MIQAQHGAVGDKSAVAAGAFSFWLTLLVTTLMAALTAYVLSGAFFEPSANGPAHRAAAIVHAHS
jgi:hypothetical protein